MSKGAVTKELLQKAGKVSPALKSELKRNNDIGGRYCSLDIAFYMETGAAYFSTKDYFLKKYGTGWSEILKVDYNDAAGFYYGFLYISSNDLDEYLNIKLDPDYESDLYYGDEELINDFVKEYDRFIEDIEVINEEGIIGWIGYETLEREIFDEEIDELVETYGEEKREIITDWIYENATEEDYCCCYDEREIERIAG